MVQIDEDEHARLDAAISAILEAWVGRLTPDAHRCADLVNLICAYELPDHYWDGRHRSDVFREICDRVQEGERTLVAWEAVNGPRHPERWRRLTAPVNDESPQC